MSQRSQSVLLVRMGWHGTAEVAQRLRVLAVLAEDPGSIPSRHSHLELQFQFLSAFFRHQAHKWHRNTHNIN